VRPCGTLLFAAATSTRDGIDEQEVSMRLLIHLDPDADATSVTAAATGAGARTILPPRPELPGVLIAVFDDDADVAAVATAIGRTDGVRAVEGDGVSWSLGEEE
jgi:hypothetical protein